MSDAKTSVWMQQPFTVAEVAKLLRRGPRWVHHQIRAGRLKVLPGKPYRITAASVRALQDPV